MSTIEKVKLTKSGESLTLSVVSCGLATVGNFPGVEFAGTTPDGRSVLLEVPQSSADRQLARLNLHTYPAVVGKTLTFSRDPNQQQPTKPFWGITLARAYQAPAKSNGASKGVDLGARIPGMDDDAPPPEPPEDAAVPEANTRPNPAREKLIASFNLYDACFDHALRVVARVPSQELDVAAIAATLYIQANK